MAIIYYIHYQRLWVLCAFVIKKEISQFKGSIPGRHHFLSSHNLWFLFIAKLNKSYSSKLIAKHAVNIWIDKKSVVTRLHMAKHTSALVLVTELELYTSIVIYLVFAKTVAVATSLKGSWAWCLEEQNSMRSAIRPGDIVQQLCSTCLFLSRDWLCCMALLNSELNCFCHPIHTISVPCFTSAQIAFAVAVLWLRQKSEHHSLSANWEEQVNVGEVKGRAESGDLGKSESSLQRKRKQPVVCFVFLWSTVEGRWGGGQRREDDPKPHKSTVWSIYQHRISTSPNDVLTQGSKDRGNQEEKCCLHQGNMQLTKLFYYSLDSWMTHLTCIYSFCQNLMLLLS